MKEFQKAIANFNASGYMVKNNSHIEIVNSAERYGEYCLSLYVNDKFVKVLYTGEISDLQHFMDGYIYGLQKRLNYAENKQLPASWSGANHIKPKPETIGTL